MKDMLTLIEHGRVGAHKSLKRKKTSNTDIPEELNSKLFRFFGGSSQQPATTGTSDDAKVVSKSASSESGEHNNSSK